MLTYITRPAIPGGYENTSALLSAASITGPANVTYALIKISSSSGRYRDDGTAPTSISGYPVAVGGTIELFSKKAIRDFQIICANDDTSVIDVLYYKATSA